MNEQHAFYRPEFLRVLRLVAAAILLMLLLAEYFFGLPAMFGMHAAVALSASILLTLVALVVGHLYDKAQSAYVDD